MSLTNGTQAQKLSDVERIEAAIQLLNNKEAKKQEQRALKKHLANRGLPKWQIESMYTGTD